MICKYPTAVYIARNDMNLQILIRGLHHDYCRNKSHPHIILRLWYLAEDLADAKYLEENK